MVLCDKVAIQLNCFKSRSEVFSVPEIWLHNDDNYLDVEVSAAIWWLSLPNFIAIKHAEIIQVRKVIYVFIFSDIVYMDYFNVMQIAMKVLSIPSPAASAKRC